MSPVSRRRFLQGMGGASAVAVTACRPITKAPPPPPPPPPVPVTERTLVVLEMAGGNDGYSMVVPYANSAYYAHRASVAPPASQVIHINSTLGWHPNLNHVASRGAAVVEGIGVPNPNGSHFDMIRRWWTGDVDGHAPTASGFFGRLCDIVGSPSAPATGVSLGWGPTPALASEQAVTLSMSPYSDARFPAPGWDPNLRATWMAAQRAMAQPDAAEAAVMYSARYGAYNALRFSDVVSELPTSTQAYPDTQLGAQLATAVRLIRANIGTRVIYVPFSGSFDTHENHAATQADLMTELDGALDAFLQELAVLGLTNKVLLASLSEFGRRADQNTDGLDHGTASAFIMAGAAKTGVYGAQPSFTSLDTDGNLIATVTMGEYYATLATWLGVTPSSVLPAAYAPIAGIL